MNGRLKKSFNVPPPLRATKDRPVILMIEAALYPPSYIVLWFVTPDR
jgi:hypothetical protein